MNEPVNLIPYTFSLFNETIINQSNLRACKYFSDQHIRRGPLKLINKGRREQLIEYDFVFQTKQNK